MPSGSEDGELDINIPDLDVPPSDNAPSFNELFEDESPEGSIDPSQLQIRTFEKITNVSEDPKPFFKDAEYYQKLLGNEGDSAKRVHQVLQAFIKAEDPQEKSAQRQRLIPAYWDFANSIAGRVGPNLTIPKQLFLRFAILLPTAIDANQRQLISSLIFKNTTGEPIHYVDEWLREVASGRTNSSAVDETKHAGKNSAQKNTALIEKAKGRYDSQLILIHNLAQEISSAEKMLLDHAQNIAKHPGLPEYNNMPGPYTDSQRNSFSEIGELLRRLNTNNKKLALAHTELSSLKDQFNSLKQKNDDVVEDSAMDSKAAMEEMGTIRQMAKMCIGRQGNHFPMLSKSYFRGTIRDIGIRENIINILADIEYLDEGLFLRTFKQQTNRIVPYIILIPCYGDTGICWEPFERFNRATSRGRIAIPMYPKDLRTAVISACADLRWQVAKEKAQHYWMEEGLTGWYYQWFSEAKIKGDVKDRFVEDYILWINKESEGTQKLERPVREIFWRYIPFPQEKKDNLKNRGFVYSELSKKDSNRAMSDGY